jgi:uncharacterized protein YggT (Ycf19 family)
MTDNKLELDEAQRAANYEAIRSNVTSEVGGEIVADARGAAPNQVDRVDNVAARMRERSVRDVEQTENEVERGRVVARISQVVDYLFFLIYGILTIRLLLELFAARESAGFFKFVKAVSDPIYSPFRGLVPSPSTPEGFTLALPIIVAIVVYMLLHLAINGFLRMIAHRKVEV